VHDYGVVARRAPHDAAGVTGARREFFQQRFTACALAPVLQVDAVATGGEGLSVEADDARHGAADVEERANHQEPHAASTTSA